MWSIVYVWCVEKGLKACWIIVDVTSCLCGCKVCDVMKVVISSLFVRTCHLHYSEALIVKVLCALRKNGYLRGCTISRDVSRAAMVTIIEGCVVRRDRCMDKYVPHGSRTERQRVCITRSDMHHYTWHCIPLHCTYLPLVNLISYFADLLIAFLRNSWLINIELVIADR